MTITSEINGSATDYTWKGSTPSEEHILHLAAWTRSRWPAGNLFFYFRFYWSTEIFPHNHLWGSLGQKCLFDARGQRMMVSWWHSNRSMQKSISERISWDNMSKFEADGPQQQQENARVPLLAKNRKPSTQLAWAPQSWTVEDWKHIVWWSDGSPFRW